MEKNIFEDSVSNREPIEYYECGCKIKTINKFTGIFALHDRLKKIWICDKCHGYKAVIDDE